MAQDTCSVFRSVYHVSLGEIESQLHSHLLSRDRYLTASEPPASVFEVSYLVSSY